MIHQGRKMYGTFKLFANHNQESYGIYFESSFREKKRNLILKKFTVDILPQTQFYPFYGFSVPYNLIFPVLFTYHQKENDKLNQILLASLKISE